MAPRETSEFTREQPSRHRWACECAEPDPVMQADEKFYCFTCSLETGARPNSLYPEDWMKQRTREQAALRALAAGWRAKGAQVDTFHATMGIGWKACAEELDAALAAQETPARTRE